MPPEYVTHDGQVVKANKGQLWLWKNWLDAIKWIKKKAAGDPYAIVLNGDIIDGLHHKNTQIVSAEIEDHIGIALACLKPILNDASRLFFIKGTECHTNGYEALIGKMLGGEVDPDTGKAAFVRLELEANGTLCVSRHHIGTTGRSWSEASQLSIHMREEQIQAARKGSAQPKVLICSHRHKFGYWGDSSALVVVTPPWQIPTRFAHKVVPSPVVEPGVVSLDFRGLARGSIPVLDWIIYEPLESAPVKI